METEILISQLRILLREEFAELLIITADNVRRINALEIWQAQETGKSGADADLKAEVRSIRDSVGALERIRATWEGAGRAAGSGVPWVLGVVGGTHLLK